ncbi:MAG: hypothetical protein HY823_12175 [Acidobacteria bacterium]|nr:hypothetical protein [Acidobacteriota bacterium]
MNLTPRESRVHLTLLLGALLGCPLLAEPPKLLSETGLYKAGSLNVDPVNRPYSPQYPLWSDGAAKHRWIFLPPGTRIDAKDPDAWDFPVGTKFWKEFSFGGRKVETRLMEKVDARNWSYASYAWNEAQTDALRVPVEGLPEHHPLPGGKRHSVPSVEDCKACHETGRPEVLGFTPLQLSTDRDPLAPHAEPFAPGMANLKTLVEGNLLDPPQPGLLRTPPRIPARSPRARAALGYLSSNCGSCHQAEGPHAKQGLLLRHLTGAKDPEAAPGLASTVDQRGRWGIPELPAGQTRRIARGEPARSSLLYRMAHRRSAVSMPPLGSVLVDEQALALLRAWVAEDLKKAR